VIGREGEELVTKRRRGKREPPNIQGKKGKKMKSNIGYLQKKRSRGCI